MRAYVAVTDGDWYRFLAVRTNVDEVNFWRPGGGRGFHVLTPGEPFFFKTHHPHNRLVGGGFYSGFAQLRISEAWELLGEDNGVHSLAQMRVRVAQYRRAPMGPAEDPVIGCVFVRKHGLLSTRRARRPAAGLRAEHRPGQGLRPRRVDVGDYFHALLARLLGALPEMDLSQPWHRPGPVYGDPRLAPQRLGQQAFQAVVLDAYHRRCAITGDKIRPVLQAAHIRPLPSGGEHRLDNGLLLRSDVHTLFDRGYLGVDPKHRLLVSPRLRDEFGNGEQFYARAGQPIALPDRRIDRPGREFLEWHLDEVFRAA